MFWNNWTYHQKLKYLKWSIPVLILVVYVLGISNTIDEAAAYYEIKDKISNYSVGEAKKQQKELNLLQQKLGKFIVDDYYTQDTLLSIVSLYCKQNRVKLLDFPLAKYTLENAYQIEHNQFKVEGGFNDILRLVDLLEKNKSIGRIVSVNWNLENDRSAKIRRLTARVHIKNIKNKHEK